MRQVLMTLGILVTWMSIACAESEFGDTRFRDDIYVWGKTPTPFTLFDEGEGSVNSPGDINAVGDIVSGGTITADDLIQMSGPFPDSQKIMRVQRTPTWTDTATPTATYATFTPTYTPTGTWNTPTITPTFTPTNTWTPGPTDEPFWLKGNGDMMIVGDLTVGGKINAATLDDISIDHLTLPGNDPTPAANEVMISVQDITTPVWEVDAEGDVTGGSWSGTSINASGDIVQDDNSGDSPMLKQIDEGEAYGTLILKNGGWWEADHSVATLGLRVKDNLVVGEPTPLKVTINGGELVVAGDSEFKGSTYQIGNLYLDDDSGQSPLMYVYDGNNNYFTFYKVGNGWATVYHSDSTQGLDVQDNLVVGDPTPTKVTINGGEFLVGGDSEHKGTGYFLGNLILDDDTGDSPQLWGISEDGAYFTLYQSNAGWAILNHSVAARGLQLLDNLTVGQPTPAIITIDGGDAVVADDFEVQDILGVGGNSTLKGNLDLNVADKKMTQPEDSSGTGPFLTTVDRYTASQFSMNPTEDGYLFATSNPSDDCYLGLPIPVEYLGGTVVIDQVTCYFTDHDSAAYIDELILQQNDGDETVTTVANNTTDIGNGTTGSLSGTILSSDVNRSTYPGPLVVKMLFRSLTTNNDISLGKIEYQWHLE